MISVNLLIYLTFTFLKVITDSASACKAAGEIITRKYPHITWCPCVAHVVDLYLEDVGRLEAVASLIENGKDVCKFICNHQQSRAIFQSFSPLELVRHAETR